jgi:hypothetical protein
MKKTYEKSVFITCGFGRGRAAGAESQVFPDNHRQTTRPIASGKAVYNDTRRWLVHLLNRFLSMAKTPFGI